MTRRVAERVCSALVLAVIAVPLAGAPSAEAQRGSGKDIRDVAPRPVTLTTHPAVAGLKVRMGRRTFVSDERGRVRLRFTLADRRRIGGVRRRRAEALLEPMRVLDSRLPDGGIARFEKLYGARAITVSRHYTVTPEFTDLTGRAIAPELIESYTVKSRHGARVTVRGAKPVELQGSRVVPFDNELVNRNIDWQVESVIVDGTNVVNRAQQRFEPQVVGGRVPIRLLFYPAHFRTRDALFGFPIGSKVRLEYPSGRVIERDLEGGRLTLDRLPRGEYQVSVVAPGFSFERPVALSRTQDVELEVISYLDLAVVGLLLGGIALTLLVARRPHLRRRLRRPLPARRAKALASIALLAAVASFVAAPERAEAAGAHNPTKLLAYYYIWFQPSSWNRAKTDFPLLGRYSSDETTVMRKHIDLAKKAGIDGFVVSWKSTPRLDERLEKLIRVAEEKRFELAVIYQGLDFERRPLAVQKVAADLDRFERRFAQSPAFRGFEKPMVIWSGTWKFSKEEIRSVTEERRDDLLVLATERNAADYLAKADVVDGDAYYWSSVNPDTYPDYPGKLAEMARAVHERGGVWIPPAAPGFDARLIGGKTVVQRDGGEMLRRQMDVAQGADPDAIGLISWNEFSENTHVEPSVEHGATALKTIADIRGGSLRVGDDLDSSAPAAAAGGPRALPAIALFLLLFAGACGLLARRRRLSPQPMRSRTAR